jgi:hypothetical protein
MWHTMTTPCYDAYVWWIWDGTIKNGRWVKASYGCEAKVLIELPDCGTAADDMVYAVRVESKGE